VAALPRAYFARRRETWLREVQAAMLGTVAALEIVEEELSDPTKVQSHPLYGAAIGADESVAARTPGHVMGRR
jgi:hypothetical protein